MDTTKCVDLCKTVKTCCNNKDCRYYIEYKEDLNCTFIAISNKGPMKLREVAERLNLSCARIKQIESDTFKKISPFVERLN